MSRRPRVKFLATFWAMLAFLGSFAIFHKLTCKGSRSAVSTGKTGVRRLLKSLKKKKRQKKPNTSRCVLTNPSVCSFVFLLGDVDKKAEIVFVGNCCSNALKPYERWSQTWVQKYRRLLNKIKKSWNITAKSLKSNKGKLTGMLFLVLRYLPSLLRLLLLLSGR